MRSRKHPVIEINPNPAHHIVKIHLKGFSHKTLSLRVMDMNGNILFSRNFNSISSEIIQTIDLNLVPTGTYIIQVIQDQQVTQSKLIKN